MLTIIPDVPFTRRGRRHVVKRADGSTAFLGITLSQCIQFLRDNGEVLCWLEVEGQSLTINLRPDLLAQVKLDATLVP